mgnify:CR=1 FL=1
MYKFIDLFCGIGGFHQALSNLGCECVFASDIDNVCRKVYFGNYGIMPDGDITKIDEHDIPEHDILCAGFPCQSFSKAGKRLGFEDKTRGTLFFEISRIIKFRKPSYIILENVKNLVSHDNGNTWKIIHETLTDLGYAIWDTPCIFSPHYIGIPQHRERVFICGVRNDITKQLPQFSFEHENIKECSIDSVLLNDDEITNIEKYKLSSEYIKWIDNWNLFVQNIKCDKLPSFPIWTEYLNNDNVNFDGMPEWKKKIIIKNKKLFSLNTEFIEDWLKVAKESRLFYGAKSKFEWQAGVNETKPDLWKTIMQIRPSGLRVKQGTYFPALVAITQTSIIGKCKRYITPRECARLQSFPDSFICDEDDKNAYRQFGNAVNVKVVELFAKFLLNIK